ncbi:MAG: type II secretion system protein [Actinomycetota bacterium]
MLKRIREEQKNEDGFTLIELMVVVLIISILIAIAIPTFLGAREGAEDRSAQSNLRNALTAAKVYYADEGEWIGAGADVDTSAEIRALVALAEPSLTFQDGAVSNASASGTVRAVFTDQSAVFSGYSESGSCFHLLEQATGATAGTYYYEVDAAADGSCADAPAANAANTWVTGGW